MTANPTGFCGNRVFWNNALINAISIKGFEETLQDPSWWGRILENAVGAHLLNNIQSINVDISYWRKRGNEVDFVLSRADECIAIEVKSGRGGKAKGLQEFRKQYPFSKALVIGGNGNTTRGFFQSKHR